MSWFDNQPVQRKLSFAMLFTSSAALVVACVVFLAVQHADYLRDLEHSVATLARITANNSSAAVAFSDQREASQGLAALKAEPQVVQAILYDARDQVFASYAAEPGSVLANHAQERLGLQVENGYVVMIEPVVQGSRRLGTLYVRASMTQIYDRMRTSTWIMLGVLVASFGLAGLLAAVLRRTLARPILELANTAGAVSANQDYSLRARQYGGDELGRLTATFNAMLERTQGAVGALRESEWSHRELVRALPTAVYMCDPRGLITLYNDAAVALWGRAPELGREYWCGSLRTYNPDGTDLPHVAGPMAVAVREGRAVRGVEMIIERPDGTRRNVLPYPEPIRDTSGALVGVVNMLVDITDQKRANVAVRRLAAIVEWSDDAIVGKDLNGIITAWNRGAERLFGYTAEQIVGQSVLTLIPPEYQDEEPGILQRIRRGEPIQHYETLRRRQDGTLVEVSLTVSPIRDANGQIVGASKIARNITERKQAERQADFLSQLSQQLSAFTDPDDIIRVASRLVGQQLGADRCFFCTLAEQPEHFAVAGDWTKGAKASANGVYEAADFGPSLMWLGLGHDPTAVASEAVHLRLNRGSGAEYLQIGAHAAAPFLRHGEWIAALVVATELPRAWRPDESALLENAMARVWPMVERARSQRQLRESERRQRELMRALPIACYTVDGEGRLNFFNEAAVGLWGRGPELGVTKWTGAQALATVDGAALPPDQCAIAVALREKRSVRGAEAVVIRPDGERRWVMAYPDPILDAAGQCIGAIDVVMDVTEERTARERVAKAADHLNLAIASAKLGDWSWDAPSDIITLSPRTAEIYGVPVEATLTRSGMRAILHEEDRERAKQALQHAIETHTDYDIEYRVNPAGGRQRWIAAKGRSFYAGDGRLLGMVGVVQDITERKQAEIELKRARDEALAASQAKDEFLAALSHELRTPLNPVLLLASSAAGNAELPPAIRADFNLIHKNVALEARLIDDLLDLTRITHGKLKLEQQGCDLHSVLRDALTHVQPEMAEKELKLATSFKAKPSTVLGDSVRLQQVFWNILKNAVKFTPEGGRIAVETRLNSAADAVVVQITDSGIGMTPAEIGRIFMAFTQGDHAGASKTSHRFGGLGLGLAITKMLVEMHGGKVSAASPGRERGSSFTIELPLHRGAKAAPARKDSAPPVPAAPLRPPAAVNGASNGAEPVRVLLVEDHAATRLTLAQLLRHRRYDVTSAASANEALRHAQAQAFDLVISDVGLPDRNGYELMGDLRRIDPQLGGIALSGYGMEEDIARSQAAGFAVHLVKPVTMARLEEAIARLLPTDAAAKNGGNPPSA